MNKLEQIGTGSGLRDRHIQFETNRFDRGWFSEQIAHDIPHLVNLASPLFDAGLISAGIAERGDHNCLTKRRHGHYIRILFQGEILLELNGQERRLQPGQMMVVPRGVAFGERNTEPVWYAYVFFKDTERWNRLHEIRAYIRDYESTHLFYLLLRSILDAKITQEHFDVMLARDHAASLLRLLIHELRRAGRPANPHRSRLLALLDRISREPERSWAVPDMARSLHLSPAHLTKLFRQEFGVPPHTSVSRIRIEAAMNRLVTTGETVSEIAFAVGYNSQFSFSRMFKKYAGVSPSDYRATSKAKQGSPSPNAVADALTAALI